MNYLDILIRGIEENKEFSCYEDIDDLTDTIIRHFKTKGIDLYKDEAEEMAFEVNEIHIKEAGF